MEIRRVGQLFLGQAAFFAQPANVGGKHIARIEHNIDYPAPTTTVLQTIVCICAGGRPTQPALYEPRDRKSTRLNSSHLGISYAVFCLKKKQNILSEHLSTTLFWLREPITFVSAL